MTITLQSRVDTPIICDWSNIAIDQWWNGDAKLISESKLIDGKELGDYFSVKVQSDTHQLLEITPGTIRIHGLGWQLHTGKIRVQGDVGHKTGLRLHGGEIEITGNTGNYAALGMSRGRLIIHGNAGDYTGSALPGENKGMRGGEVLIRGNSGDFTGHRQRRGLIFVHGNTGFCLGEEMLAGTIVVGQIELAKLGKGVRRGSIVGLNHVPVTDLPGYQYACTYQPTWWRVYVNYLEQQQLLLNPEPLYSFSFLRFTGDLRELNKAEILVRSK